MLSFALITVAVEEPPVRSRTEPARRMHLADLARLKRPFWTVVVLAAVLTLARFSEAFLVLKAQATGLSVALVPAIMVVMNIAYALSAYPAGVLSDRAGRRGVLTVGLAALIAADLVLALGTRVAWVGAGAVLWGLHMGLTQGLLASLVADTAPEDLRGSAFGFFNLVTGIAMLAASVIAGALWDAYGPMLTFLAGAAFTAVALLGVALVQPHYGVGQAR
jgi:MFS family permease